MKKLIAILLVSLVVIYQLLTYIEKYNIKKLKERPLTIDEISKLELYTYKFDLCYPKESDKINYINNVLNGKYEASRFLSKYDQNIILRYAKECEKILSDNEMKKLNKMENDELINLQKSSLNNHK